MFKAERGRFGTVDLLVTAASFGKIENNVCKIKSN
jgi:hypothetical protein